MRHPTNTGNRRRSWQYRLSASWRLPLFVFVLSTAMSLGVYAYLARQAEVSWRADIARDAALITNELRDRLRAHAQFLRGVRGLFAASADVTPDEWRAYVRQLQIDRNVPGVQAYGYASVEPHDRPAPRTGGTLTIRYIAPDSTPNRTAQGFNLLSEARRSEAVETARDRDEVVLSRRIELVQEGLLGTRQPGLLMVLPVYRQNMSINTIEERRQAFTGVVYAAYRIGDFMQSLNYVNNGTLQLRILDEDTYNTGLPEMTLSLLHASNADERAEPVEIRELEFGQRNWHLRFFASRGSAPIDTPLWMLVSGLLVSFMLAAASRIQTTYRLRAERLAREMTAELRRSEERFKLVAEGANDGIWDRDLKSGSVWHSERLKQMLGFPAGTNTEDVAFFLSRIHPDDRASLDKALQTYFATRQPYLVEYRFRKGDGRWAWFRSHGQGVWDDAGNPVRLVGSVTDISEQKAAAERIVHYRDFLHTVLKFIPHPVFVKNRNREYIAVNSAFCHFVGREEHRVLGRVDLGRTPMEESVAQRIREMDERVFAGEGEQIEEVVLTLRRGVRTVIARKALASDPDGAPILIGTLTDITDLREAERERAAADRQRKAILEAATEVSIIATDVSGTIRVFNRGAEKLLGYRAEELVGRETPARIHLDCEVAERGRFLSAELGYPIRGFEVFVAMPKLHGVESREWTYVRKDGSRCSVSLVVTAMRDDQGALVGYLGIATDITERKAATAALERQTAQMRTIIEHIPGGVSLIDPELHFIAANKELQRVLEFPDSLFACGWPSLYEVALFNARRGDYGPGDHRELAMAVVEKARHPTAHHFERTRPNGRTIEVRGTPLPDGGFVTIYTDITERKEAEAELRKHRDHLAELVAERTADLSAAKEAAERASEAKSEFLANMSHELRTPMHSVLSFATLGEEKATAIAQERLAHYFHRIHQSGDRLLSLLNNLLDLSKLEAGMMALDVKSVDVVYLVRDAIVESEGWATSRQIRVALSLAFDNLTVEMDPIRIGQVVRNLLSNAIKFSPEGASIDVSITKDFLPRGRRATDPEDVTAVRITVSDNGIGIPDDEIETIFEKFVQSSKTKTGAGGTGLGLAICRQIVVAHRGTIVACNNVNGGARFVMTLPLSQQPLAQAQGTPYG